MIGRQLIFALAGCVHAASLAAAESSVLIRPIGGDRDIPAILFVPEGSGPFPAVVVLHDCSGLGPKSSGAPKRWAQQLVRDGYVVLLPDSFGPRGFADGICTTPPDKRTGITYEARGADAYGALAYLRTLPAVEGRRVGVMGGSHGGSGTLISMYEPVSRTNFLVSAKRNGFEAGIALYPGCAGPFGAWTTKRDPKSRRVVSHAGVYKPIAPLLILIGDADDWTPAEDCRRLTEASAAAGLPVEIEVYAGAHHSFDSANPIRFNAERTNANSPTGKGATTGGNAQAWTDARAKVRDFFAKHLVERR